MHRSRRLLAVAPSVRTGGLVVPTLVAALVCGASVFAIAASGALAMDAAAPVRVVVPAPADPLGGPPARATVVTRAAPTGRDYRIAVVGPGFDEPGGGAPGTERVVPGAVAPRPAPPAVAAAQPTVVFLAAGLD